MIAETCAFETERLIVKQWHALASGQWPSLDLPTVIAEMMTDAVTRYLPMAWRGPYTVARAEVWIAERDEESPTLLAVDRSTGEAAGLVILFESVADTGEGTDLRLGYLLAEAAWGQGLATELLDGLIRWCRDQPDLVSLSGGVATINDASTRVLDRLGFTLVDTNGPATDDELLYQLNLYDA